MKSKCVAVAVAVGIVLLYWFGVLYFQTENVGRPFYAEAEAEGLRRQYTFTDLDNSRGKMGKAMWNSIQPAFKCPDAHLSRVGTSGDGGKYVCGFFHLGSYFEQNPDVSCTVYSFGVNADSSFEAQVLTNTRCSVYAYDPTVNSIAQPLNSSNPRVHFFKIGVGGSNTENRKTLKTMMEENGGHKWIDILKMDVEGAEYATFDNVFQDFDELPIGQLLVELHYGKHSIAKTEKILQLIINLELRGLRMFSKELNLYYPECCSEFSFININYLDRFVDTKKIQ